MEKISNIMCSFKLRLTSPYFVGGFRIKGHDGSPSGQLKRVCNSRGEFATPEFAF